MTPHVQYSRYHPKWYRTRMPIFWWVHKWAHTKFILRELTSVFIAFYALVLLGQIRALTQGLAPITCLDWSSRVGLCVCGLP